MAVRTERSEVRKKTTEGQHSPVRLELARLVSSLLYGTRTMLVLSLQAFENKKYTAYDRFHGDSPYGEIPTKKEPISTLTGRVLHSGVSNENKIRSCSKKQNIAIRRFRRQSTVYRCLGSFHFFIIIKSKPL